MSADDRKPLPVPDGFSAAASESWNLYTQKYVFRADELQVLEAVCRTQMRIDDLNDELKNEPNLVTGSTGQVAVHPLFAEIRAQEAHHAKLVKQLNLPDDASAAGESSRSTNARKAAQSRWAMAHGAAG